MLDIKIMDLTPLKKITSPFKRLFKFLSPIPDIGGLEISDAAIKLAFIKKGKPAFASVNLPAGAMADGKVLDKEKLTAALKELHAKFVKRANKKLYVVVNVSDANVYSQVFNLPNEAIDNLEEAATLNLQMISPTEFSGSYSDWQKIGELNFDGGQLEILSVFVTKKVIDDIAECLKEASFTVAAIEPASLALARLAVAVSQNPNFILLHLGAGGLNFIFVKNNNFYFSHFAPWPKGEERQIKLSTVESLLVSETQRTLNFVSGHWPETKVGNFLLATPALDDKIADIILKNFNLPSQKIVLPVKIEDKGGLWAIGDAGLASLTSDWFSPLGSAARGLIFRSKDIIVSIASAGTEQEFKQDQIISFAGLWRNIFAASMLIILIAFASIDAFISGLENTLNTRSVNLANLPMSQDVLTLQKQAKEFNAIVDTALKAKSQIYDFSPIVDKINNLATQKNVSLTRIFVPSLTGQGLVNGQAADYQSILNFKQAMESDPQFTAVDMPLTSVVINSQGLSSFSISFNIKK